MPYAGKPRTEKQLENDKRLAEMNHSQALFASGDEFIDRFEEYLKDQDSTFTQRPPSFSRFADWLEVSRKKVLYYVGKWPEADRTLRQMIADVLVEHAIIGDYRDAVSIFTLKNRCDWTDKKETVSVSRSSSIATPEEVMQNMNKIKASLGFDDHSRPGKIGKKNVSDLEGRIIKLAEAKSE